MARLLLSGPNHTPHDRKVLAELSIWLTADGHEVHDATPRTDVASLVADVQRLIQSCDAVIAVLDGIPFGPGTAWLVATAHGLRRPILGLRSDSRAVPADAANRLVTGCVQDILTVQDWAAPDLRPAILEFARNVRVFAGALVRDSVPKILKEEGRELKFRQVNENEYPRVLKRKVVEAAQRVEEAEWGVEQEEIADLLELLETLINLRKYDKESLRSIKEGKWRKRGGFQKGFLLEEEPKLSSG